MKIKRVLYASGLTGFYSDDMKAIRKGAKQDGFIYRGKTLTPGFNSIRQPGEVVSVIFVLDNGDIAFG